MASRSPDVHGSRAVTDATAPATAPRTAVAADDSRDGLDPAIPFRFRTVAAGFREVVERDAADRAAVLRFCVLVCAAARLAAPRRAADAAFRRRTVGVLRAVFDRFFAPAPARFFVDARLATLPPIPTATDHADRCGRRFIGVWWHKLAAARLPGRA